MKYWNIPVSGARTKPVTEELLEALRFYADPNDRTPNTPAILLGVSETESLMETFKFDLQHLVRAAHKLGWNHVNAAGMSLYLSANVIVGK